MRSRRPKRGDAAAGTHRRQRRLGAYALALAAVWTTLGVYAVHGQMPRNVVELPFEAQLRPLLPFITPEGWAFFTRSPREPKVYPFRRTAAGKWEPATLGPYAEPRNLFGLDRRPRAQAVELALLLGMARASSQRDCPKDLSACFDRLEAIPLRNVSPDPTLCGDVAIALREPVPWAWSGSSVVMPAKAVRLTVTC